MLTSISRPALLCLPYPAREHLSPILPGANVAGNSGLICCRQALQPSINSACRTAQFPPGEWGGGGSREKRQRYLIASSAQFPCLAPTVCVCVCVTYFIHSFSYTCWCFYHVNTDSLVSLCSPHAALENAVLCVRVCEALISLATHLSNTPAPWVSCIINQKTVFACIVSINHASTVVERKPRFRKMLMSHADCEFSIVCLDSRHK